VKPRFVESSEERAIRIARMAARMAGPIEGAVESGGETTLLPPDVLEQRMAHRLANAAPDMPDDVAKALAATKAREGHAIAEKLARDEIDVADLSDAALANLESVIRVSDRPSWYVRDDRPQIEPTDRNSEFWIVHATAATKKMRNVCSSVGCIVKEQESVRTPIGTGWLVGELTLVTNAHVADHLARHKAGAPADDWRGGWRLRPDVKGTVDFTFEHENTTSRSIRIVDVLYVESAPAPDIAFFRIENARDLPPGIVLDLEAERAAGWPDTYVFAVGHPIADVQDDPNVPTVFGSLDGTKRVAPGQLNRILGNDVLAHDCSTTNGSSGSPLIDFGSYRAVGLHYFGKPGERNEAVFLPAIAKHPGIVKNASQGWGI
jgi:hypothetical protein